MTLGCEDKRIRQIEFIAKTHLKIIKSSFLKTDYDT